MIELTNYWLSWYHRSTDPAFRLDWPWWVTSTGDTVTICAAIRAESEDVAWAIVRESHAGNVGFTTRFCEAKPADWTPFSDRFPRAEWMQWPVVEVPDALAAAPTEVWIEGPPTAPGTYEIKRRNGRVMRVTTCDDDDIVRHRPADLMWEDVVPSLLGEKLSAATARVEWAEKELAELRKAAGIKSDERVTAGFDDGSMRVVTDTGTVRRVWPGSGVGEKELAVAESERAIYRRLHEADLTELAAAQQREAKLREALRWYVDNDDTNLDTDNEFWLDGYKRAKQALSTKETTDGDL